MDMVILLAIRWWYTTGWQWAWQRSVTQRLSWCLEAFSIKALIRTWLSPFKQTYSSAKKGSIDLKVQAAVDNLVSRIIGSLARTVIILGGLLCMILSFASGIIIFLAWPFVPLVPLIGVALMMLGVGA